LIELRPEKLMSDSEGSSGFSGARRTIKEHVRAASGFEGVGENSNYFFLVSNVFDLPWPVFLDPWLSTLDDWRHLVLILLFTLLKQ
jgi:hypothetical protein